MALTDDERHRLDQISGELLRTDRELDRLLSIGIVPHRRMKLAGSCAVASSLVPFVVGVVVDQVAWCLIAWLLFMTGLVLRSLAG